MMEKPVSLPPPSVQPSDTLVWVDPVTFSAVGALGAGVTTGALAVVPLMLLDAEEFPPVPFAITS
jgi:hypothetical protein